jgi:hypothetical protein
MIAIATIAAACAGCKPSGPPADLVKTQREDMEKAKAVSGQLQQQADEQKKAADEAGK